MNALRIEYDEDRKVFLTETTIYPKMDGVKKGQLAIRFFDKDDNAPYIEMPTGEKNYFSKIIDPDTGFSWWIVKSKWVNENKQWFGIAPNIVGKVQLSFQNQRCEVFINGSDFSYGQLEEYLRTFKNDLWELILDENSAVTSEAKESNAININYEIIDCINNLISNAEKILKTPKVELREIQSLKLRKFVKPVNRTFMEIAAKANQRFLTSRAAEPSYNVAENRYVLFALERCYRIIKQIVILAENKSNRLNDTAEKLKNQLDSFSDSVRVNRGMVVADLKKIRERTKLEHWQEKIQKKIIENGIALDNETCTCNLKIKTENYSKNQHTGEPNGFFILIFHENKWIKPEGKSGILSLRDNFSELTSVLEPGMTLKINCDYKCQSKERSVLYNFIRIHSIEFIDSIAVQKAKDVFKKERNIGKDLDENDWVKPLSKQEIDEQEKEKQALNNRIIFYKKNQTLSSDVYKKVEPKHRALKKIIKQFKDLDVTSSSHFPNSMTFVQNPHYQGLHNGYKILRDITNLNDDELLISLEEIYEIGLLNIPLIYERWVLIQIILVLKEKFRFVPQSDWKYKVIEAVKTSKTDINISMSNELAKRHISLWYEKSLPNNKRPDFVLDLTWHAEGDNEKQKSFFKRFVLDAKFYDKTTFTKAGGMMSKLNELYIDKDYSENCNNPVFLIHPCNDIIDPQVTPQTWGKYSFLGEINTTDSEDFPQHRKGSIYLNPIDRVLYADELQRLLGLFLQYKLEPSSTDNLDNDKTQAVPICISCGSTHIKHLKKSSSYQNSSGKRVKRTPRSVWMQCTECEQIQIYNHCANKSDHGTRLIKNGLYWSYHSARALEPFNMKCPNCGEWGAW